MKCNFKKIIKICNKNTIKKNNKINRNKIKNSTVKNKNIDPYSSFKMHFKNLEKNNILLKKMRFDHTMIFLISTKSIFM